MQEFLFGHTDRSEIPGSWNRKMLGFSKYHLRDFQSLFSFLSQFTSGSTPLLILKTVDF